MRRPVTVFWAPRRKPARLDPRRAGSEDPRRAGWAEARRAGWAEARRAGWAEPRRAGWLVSKKPCRWPEQFGEDVFGLTIPLASVMTRRGARLPSEPRRIARRLGACFLLRLRYEASNMPWVVEGAESSDMSEPRSTSDPRGSATQKVAFLPAATPELDRCCPLSLRIPLV
jgi:hypothetical protein